MLWNRGTEIYTNSSFSVGLSPGGGDLCGEAVGFLKTSCFAYKPCHPKSKYRIKFWPWQWVLGPLLFVALASLSRRQNFRAVNAQSTLLCRFSAAVAAFHLAKNHLLQFIQYLLCAGTAGSMLAQLANLMIGTRLRRYS